MRIVVPEFMDERAVACLAAAHDVMFDAALVDEPVRLAEVVASADALIVRNRTQVSGALLAAARKLRVVGRLGVGLDNIDVAECAARGIVVIPATGANAQAVAEYVVAAALLLLRGAYRSSDEVAAGGWPRSALSNGREIAGKTLGVVGFGSIGEATAVLAGALGMRVIAFDPLLATGDPRYRAAGVEPIGLDALLATSDVVSLHVPLGPETRGLIDARRLATMKADAVLVNSARGGIVDEAALAEALRSGRLGGAALDVFAAEPLAATTVFAGCPNLILTPHIAGVTRESNERVSFLIAGRVLAALR